jgi:hypothetical protein
MTSPSGMSKTSCVFPGLDTTVSADDMLSQPDGDVRVRGDLLSSRRAGTWLTLFSV